VTNKAVYYYCYWKTSRCGDKVGKMLKKKDYGMRRKSMSADLSSKMEMMKKTVMYDYYRLWVE